MGELRFSENSMEFKSKIDWQTPDVYLEAARKVMGDIDLDPSSSDSAQKRIKAKRYYTRHTNGLDKVWSGRVWLNPAYSIMSELTDKLLYHYDTGDITQAIFITHTLRIWDSWFQAALRACNAVCFMDHLVKWHPGHLPDMKMITMFQGKPEYDVRGTAAFYFGLDTEKFRQAWGKFGAILL